MGKTHTTKGMTQMRNNVYLYHRNVNDFTKEVKKLREIGEKHGFNVVERPEDANIIVAIGEMARFTEPSAIPGSAKMRFTSASAAA